MFKRLGEAAIAQGKSDTIPAVGPTGLETSTASAHFVSRSEKQRHRWVKLSVIVLGDSLLPLCADIGWDPSNDKTQAPALLEEMVEGSRPHTLYADAGYDAEWIHGYDHDVNTVIKPVRYAADGSHKGDYRGQMGPQYPEQHHYSKRWLVETYNSGLDRAVGSTLNASKQSNLLIEAAFNVLTYARKR